MALLPSRTQLTTDDVPGAPSWIQPLLERINGFTGPVYDALSRGLTFDENFSGEVTDVLVTPPPEWVPLTLLGGFVLFGAAQFGANAAVRCNELGDCEARGLIKSNAAVPANTRLANLPPGFAPPPDGDRRCLIETGGSAGGIEVLPAGAPMPTGALVYLWGNVGLMDLSGVRWRSGAGPVNWPTPVDIALRQQPRRFPGKPGFVLPLGVSRVDGRPTMEMVTTVGWEPTLLDKKKGTPGLRISRLSGLTPGVQYRVTLLVLPE